MSDRDDVSIRCRAVGKRFDRAHDPYLGLRTRLHRIARRPLVEAGTIWALRDVSFDVQPGRILGLIGRNGSGKSVLLRILARVTRPTSGRSELQGAVSAILNLGAMLHPELTGRQNIYQTGTLLRLRRATIDRRFEEIVEFAGIEAHLDTLVRSYSAGMQLRLAFAVVAHLESEILLVDEALAVADEEFRERCLARIREMASDGRTIAIVSHDLGMVAAVCDEALVLDEGRLMAHGPARSIVSEYRAHLAAGSAASRSTG